MTDSRRWTRGERAFAACIIIFTLLLYGAVPFLMMPTLGQAIWSLGFAESIAKGPLLGLHALDFGIPAPAPISFGLAGAWPASLLIRFGMPPAEAYDVVAASWLLVAFSAAFRIAREFGVARYMALLGAATWLTMPIVWGHLSYSMLSSGIALLPFYFLATFHLLQDEAGDGTVSSSAAVRQFATACVAIFMDGYTFMMFATGSSLLLGVTALQLRTSPKRLWRSVIPVHVASFLLAYVLYSRYIGKSDFDSHPIGVFADFGLDLSYFLIPSKGVQWLPDWLHLSRLRGSDRYPGDASVWTTTFALPVALAGCVAWWLARRREPRATGMLLVATIAFYLALGPTLKVNATKTAFALATTDATWGTRLALKGTGTPTGSAWISEHLPGFNVMRAAYRWSALGIFAFWLLIMISAADEHGWRRRRWGGVLLALMLVNLPNLPQRWQRNLDNRDQFHQLGQEFIDVFRQRIHHGETVAFVPWGNDFLANFLAPVVGFRTYNIGGDKALQDAQQRWPRDMLAQGSPLDERKASGLIRMLIDGTADVIVVPYINLLWSPHLWPCLDETSATLTPEEKTDIRQHTDFVCPSVRKAEMMPVIRAMQASSLVEIFDGGLFATVRLRPALSGMERHARAATVLGGLRYPMVPDSGMATALALSSGWHEVEGNRVWSDADASLTLPLRIPDAGKACYAILSFQAFGASPQRPVSVRFTRGTGPTAWNSVMTLLSSGEDVQVRVPLDKQEKMQRIHLSVPDATSPNKLTGSADGRILGISLARADIDCP